MSVQPASSTAETSPQSPDLFTPIMLGELVLPHRVIMAPLTRNRAGDGFVPGELNAKYYAQRASAGLIISEATQVARAGLGYPDTPGIYSDDQVEGWRLVTDAVHREGGRIFLQLWHVGRISHPSLQENGELPVAPSAIRPDGNAMTYEGEKPFVTPRALETDEIPAVVEQFRAGAENARRAGFDGVEVHSANGYLLDQFLRDGTNHRQDRYGGSLENRARFPLEVVEAVLDVWPAGRVGVRLSPSSNFNEMSDSDPKKTFGYMAESLNRYRLAYLHIIEPNTKDSEDTDSAEVPTSLLRSAYGGNLMVNGDYNGERGNDVIARGVADVVAFGRTFLANPDLPTRLENDAPLNEPNPATFYGGGEEGYVDYPTLAESRQNND